MRVALVCGTYAPKQDGVADYVRRLAEALPAVGVDAVIAAAHARDGVGGREGAARRKGLQAPDHVAVTDRWSPSGALRAARALGRLGCDLVHVQYAPSAYGFSPGVGLLPAALRTPLVTTLHEYGWWSWPARLPGALWRGLERAGVYDRESGLLAPRSRALIVTNDAHARAVRARHRREPDLIPVGANVSGSVPDRLVAAAAVRRRLGVPADRPLLVFFGFVHPVKGVRELIDALRLLQDAGRPVHLAVVGGFASLALPGQEAASFRAEIDRRIADRAVEALVSVLGYREPDEVAELLAAADGVVLPFTAGVTTKSGSLIAALAHGAPVLATIADDPDPALRDGDTILAIRRRRDGPAIAEAVRRLLDDPAVAATVAARGRRFAEARSWPAIAAAHAEVYTRVLA